MNAVTDFRAHTAALRRLYGRTPSEIVTDLRAGTNALLELVDGWGETAPTSAAIASASTSAEGICRSIAQLRLAIQSPQDAA